MFFDHFSSLTYILNMASMWKNEIVKSTCQVIAPHSVLLFKQQRVEGENGLRFRRWISISKNNETSREEVLCGRDIFVNSLLQFLFLQLLQLFCFSLSNGLVVKVLHSQSKDPMFKTTGWFQARISLSSFQGQRNEYQEFRVESCRPSQKYRLESLLNQILTPGKPLTQAIQLPVEQNNF